MKRIIPKRCVTLCVCMWIVLLWLPVAFGEHENSKEALLAKWEQVQRHDPNTVEFNKIDDKLYKFKTQWFPFDGELKVLNIVIAEEEQDYYDEEYPAVKTGVVEAELLGAGEDFFKKYAYSYAMWAQNNRFFFDKASGAWLTPKEYALKMREQYKAPVEHGRIFYAAMEYFPVLFILFFVFVMFAALRQNKRIMKMNKDYIEGDFQKYKTEILEKTEKSLKISGESLSVLKEILRTLKENK